MKMNMRTVVAGAMVLATTCSATAFANEEVKQDAPVSNTIEAPVVQGDVMLISAKEEAKEELPAYITQTGKITNILGEDGYTRVEIGEAQNGLVMNIADGTMVLDRKTNEFIKVSDLKQGMEVCAVIPGNAPMTMSLPPMTNSVSVLVANADAGNVAVGKFDKELVNAEAKLMLNIDEKTMISDTTGARRAFTAEDVKEQNAVVFYDATTKSIPAQTTPSRVLILVEKEVVKEDTTEVPELKPEPRVHTDVALREVAEKAGYKVTWVANNKPVVVEKEGLKIEVTLGAKAYIKNGEKMEAADPVVMENGKMMVCGDVAELLK